MNPTGNTIFITSHRIDQPQQITPASGSLTIGAAMHEIGGPYPGSISTFVAGFGGTDDGFCL